MIYKNLTTEVLELVSSSIENAKKIGEIDISTESLLKTIITQDTILRNILEDLEVDIEGILNQLDKKIKANPIKYHEGDDITFGSFSKEYRQLFESAHDLAFKNKDKYLALDILIIAGISEDAPFYKILQHFVDLNLLELYITSLRGDRKINSKEYKEQSFLTTFCVNLNEKYAAGECDLVFGRVDEIDRVANILTKRTKNNPILVGEPGVGKTAIAEGIAGKIVEHNIENLDNYIIWNLNLTALKSNASSNEVSGRMNGLISEIQRKNKLENVVNILFIDEIHLIVEGGMDLANILKPALARGELKTIGATTIEEYNKYFEKDAAIQRRFQLVKIDEPDEEQALTILKGVREKIAKYHNIYISDDALVSAVRLSKKYITDRFLPDKAIDLLDEASSVVANSRFIESAVVKNLRLEKEGLVFKLAGLEKSILNSSKKEFIQKQTVFIEELVREIEAIDAEILKLEEAFAIAKEKRKEIMGIQRKIKAAEEESFKAKADLNLEKVFEIETKTIPTLTQEKKVLEDSFVEVYVDHSDIASVVENWTGIPMEKLVEDNNNIKNIQALLADKIYGQPEAIEAISKSIRRNSAGLGTDSKPIGSFMFLGPTGTGKTETAKAIAEIVFGDKSKMIRFDMSEFQESHTVSKFIGSPSGYVGHDEGGQLTNAVKREPYSLILFDEIEKAHPKVFDVLLQVLDDGRLRDGKGTVVDFTNTIIVFTSNIGGTALAKIPNKVVQDSEKMRILQKTYRPEFLNRLDNIVVYNQLDVVNLIGILNAAVSKLNKRLWEDRYVSIIVSDEFKANLIASIDIKEFGARPLQRLVDTEIEDKITDFILDEILVPGNEIIFEISPEGQKIVEVI